MHDAEGGCPFCPGREIMTPHSIREYRDSAGQWIARVFHDRAPLFVAEGNLDRRGEGMFDRMNTVGAQRWNSTQGKTLAQLPHEHIGHSP